MAAMQPAGCYYTPDYDPHRDAELPHSVRLTRSSVQPEYSEAASSCSEAEEPEGLGHVELSSLASALAPSSSGLEDSVELI